MVWRTGRLKRGHDTTGVVQMEEYKKDGETEGKQVTVAENCTKTF